MAKTRMNQEDRQSIVAAILDHKFKPVFLANNEEQYALALRIYDTLYDEKTKEWIKQAPEGWLPHSTSVTVNAAGRKYSLHFGLKTNPATNSRLWTQLPVCVRHADSWNYACKTFVAGDELGEAIAKNANEAEDLKNLHAKAKEQLVAALSALRSFEDVLEKWPEVESFVKPRMQARCVEVPGLPAVKFSDLNAMLGLPPETSQPIGAAQPK